MGTVEYDPTHWTDTFNRAVESTQDRPYDWQVWHLRARAAVALLRWEAAQYAFERTLALTPGPLPQAEVWMGLAFVHQMKAEYPEALVAVNRAMVLVPQHPGPHLKRAEIFRDCGAWADSEQEFATVVHLQKQHDHHDYTPEIHYLRGFLYFRLQRWEAGWRDFLYRWSCQEFVESTNLSCRPTTDCPIWIGGSMSDRESLITDDDGKIIGKDTTEYHEDGSSTTTHQEAFLDWKADVQATRITGVTENDADGNSTHTSR